MSVFAMSIDTYKVSDFADKKKYINFVLLKFIVVAEKKIVETPLMKQFFEMKKKHPDAIMLYRVGDFYETFSTDAVTASEILGITLTKRANGPGQHIEQIGRAHV